MEKSESEIQYEGIEYLKHHPRVAIVFRIDTDRRRTRKYAKGNHHGKGLPDCHGMLTGGQYFCGEFKKPGGKLSESQRHFINIVNAKGGEHFVAYSKADVEKWIEGI